MIEVTNDDVKAIVAMDKAFSNATFFQFQGSEISSIERARLRVLNLAGRIQKHIEEEDKKTAEKMANKLKENTKPKEPIKSNDKGKK